jgi:hypothetical protein
MRIFTSRRIRSNTIQSWGRKEVGFDLKARPVKAKLSQSINIIPLGFLIGFSQSGSYWSVGRLELSNNILTGWRRRVLRYTRNHHNCREPRVSGSSHFLNCQNEK